LGQAQDFPHGRLRGLVTRAGETLNMSQSAVSRQVSALEGELGTPLFHRHARGLILTEEGELLMRAARDIMHKLDQGARAARRFARAADGRAARHDHGRPWLDMAYVAHQRVHRRSSGIRP
jgi:DNA-binding transcriptional LysR family regulator